MEREAERPQSNAINTFQIANNKSKKNYTV